MQKEILTSIENVEIYPIISLLVFVLFFVGMGWWVLRVDKRYIDHMKSLPVDDDHQKEESHEKK
ncbi:cbb3-type cytochrome c oxidase subunit 3 [Echinicola vietnamensis]|uniref:Cbb3-type cytochrome oxidase component FixQ n=1 Tax=Echinicola vietnamensis (strain DSM 17526 / LMG 23754 / KMM 6221) TaxID=926556 RepID=L0G2Q8_ECHVK|nr:cbb3-type cytochrome c oxidase subunit 3 [Echinicola vietnamensis]AGA79125.1 Cbb3-type cytochrome oxidase component FixQ [Echinicola vietnamensis DSM 17526]